MHDKEKRIIPITLDEIKTLKGYGDFYYIIDKGLKVPVGFTNRDSETLLVTIGEDRRLFLQYSIELADAVSEELEIKNVGMSIDDGMYEFYDEGGKVVIRLSYQTYNFRPVVDLI